MAARKRYTRRKTTRKSYYSRLARKPTTAQSSYSRCVARGGKPRYCFRRALKFQKPWYFVRHQEAETGDIVTSILPKPGFFKAILLQNPKIVRYLADNETNRQAYDMAFWNLIEFDPSSFAHSTYRSAVEGTTGPVSAGTAPTSGATGMSGEVVMKS